ncbi:MAG: ScpA family protein [Kiritimatiellia bacterium]|nr:segregation/condensation protein A [Lentisphaerota bacterium]
MEAVAQEDYKVRLEVFEGPLDLLLYLIKKDEVDIYNIPIELITRQYMEYIQLMRLLDLNIAGEFLVMAATLMMIKSRMLLPVDERPDLEPEEEDPRWELVRQLVEYKKFKDAAGSLQEMELRQENVFDCGADDIQLEPDVGTALGDITIFDLIAAFNEVLKRAPREEAAVGEIFAERHTVADKIQVIRERLLIEERVSFGSLFASGADRNEIACTFLALLELIRLLHICVRQNMTFGEIMLERAAPADTRMEVTLNA